MSAQAQEMKTFVYDLIALVSGKRNGSRESNVATEVRHHQPTTVIRTVRKKIVPRVPGNAVAPKKLIPFAGDEMGEF
jgi:hypothetical protein